MTKTLDGRDQEAKWKSIVLGKMFIYGERDLQGLNENAGNILDVGSVSIVIYAENSFIVSAMAIPRSGVRP